MDALQYHSLANTTLEHWFSRLEPAYDAALIDELELEGGILTIKTPSARTYLMTKHAPTMQLWYASPISGGLHFRYDAERQDWTLPDGRAIGAIVTAELANEKIDVSL